MIAFLLVFFTVSIFDLIELFKYKRKNELWMYGVLCMFCVVLAFIYNKYSFDSSLARIFLDLFGITH